MRLLRLSEVEIRTDDKVFHSSRTRPVLLVIAISAVCGSFVIYGWKQGFYLGYYFAGAILFFALLLRGYIVARYLPTNWLLRQTPEGLFIKFRSYLNHQLPDTDPTVVFFSYPEIRSVRRVRQRVKLMDASGLPMVQTSQLVEFELAGDPAMLAKAIEAEMARPAPAEKHWYGSTSTLYRDYPVRLTPPAFLQVRWSSVVPGPAVLINGLRPFTVIESPVVVSEDFANLQSLTRDQQEQHLRELDAQGKTIAAVYAARRLYSCSMAEATLLIDDLRNRRQAPKIFP
jgi:hypothetical protein